MTARSSPTAGFDFRKMEGAGNDFVVIDARRAPGPRLHRARIATLLDRRFGIGGDGLLRLRSGTGSNIAQVDYWNADGGRASFCGNGARCAGKLLLDEAKPSVPEVRFRLERVTVRARRAAGQPPAAATRVLVSHPHPTILPLPATLPPGPRRPRPGYLHSGVPHWILPVRDLAGFDLARYAPPIRHHVALAPEGSNVDAVEERDGAFWVRTWERGVEGETLACGSGLLAVAWWAVQKREVDFPVRLRSASGARFTVTPDGENRLWLEGPASEVFRGRWSS